MSGRRFGRTWRRLRTVPGLGGHVAAVVVLVLGAIAVTGTMLSASGVSLPWQGQRTVKVEFAEAPGVTTESSQAVTIAGVDIGKITSAEPSEDGKAILTLTIDDSHPIYDNARAVLRSVNPLNQMFVELNPGGPPGRPLADDAVLPVSQTERPVQLDEVMKHLDEPAQKALSDLLTQADVALARAPEEFPPGLRATDATLETLQPVVEKLETRREAIRRLVTSLGQIAQAAGGNQDRALRLADSAEQTLAVLAQSDDELRAGLDQLPGLSEELRNALTGTQRLTDQLDPTLDNLRKASAELPETLDRLADTSRTLGETVDAARPVVSAARPLVADLRPFVADVDAALDDVRPVTGALDKDTGYVVDYLTEIQAFVYNTSSVFGIEDGRSGIIRGHAVVPLPDGGALPNSGGGYAPTPEESGMPAVGGAR